MMQKAEASLPHSGKKRWWTGLFLATKWGDARETSTSSPRQQPEKAQTRGACPQPRTFKPRDWFRWRWKKTEAVRSKMRWGSLSYIATTWDEELTSTDCSGTSALSEVKVDGDGNPGRQCHTDVHDPGSNGEVPEDGDGMMLPRERMTQAVLFGATFAATLYVFYRIGFRNRWWRWRSPVEREASGDDAKDKSDGAEENGDYPKENSHDRKESGDGTKGAFGGCVGSDCQNTDRNPDATPESTLTDMKKAQEGGTAGCKDTAAYTRAPEVTPGSPGREGPSDTESLTESVLAEVDDLIAADSSMPLPTILAAAAPREFREVSGEEVDALVSLTRRAIARDPSALSEIARQAAAQGVDVSATGDTAVEVTSMTWRDERASIEAGEATSAVNCNKNAAPAAAVVVSGVRRTGYS